MTEEKMALVNDLKSKIEIKHWQRKVLEERLGEREGHIVITDIYKRHRQFLDLDPDGEMYQTLARTMRLQLEKDLQELIRRYEAL